MAQLINLRLTRNDQSSPWGFRLQGGKDFGTPLLIQKVNFGSLAEKAGLQVGDALVKVNGQDVSDARHKDAQDIILGAGNAFEVTLQRGGVSTWKPSVTPIGPSPVPSRLTQSPQLVTKTSLAKVGPQSPAFGSSHNSVSRPFSGSPKVHGGESGTVKAIVNKQYNTPVGIYSEENIAETLTAQAELLAGGVLGVNFKKNEKNYEVNQSEVFKMVQEADKEPKDVEAETYEGVIDPPIAKAPLRHVSAPEPKAPQSAPNQNVCGDCERLIVGVFVRIKDKNLHVECFKCATCGSSLKNVGYFNINNKLYCDIHAKLVPKQIPALTPDLEPVTVPPISQHFKDVQLPRTNALSPIPFHAPKAPSHVNAPKIQTPSNVYTNTKPQEAPKQTPAPPTFTGGFNHVQTGFNSQMKTKPISTDEPKYNTNTLPRLPFLKPKPSTGSAFCPVVSKSVSNGSGKRASICSQEVSRTMTEFKHSLNDSIAAQMLIESTKKGRPQSPVPDDKGQDFTSAEIPDEVQSFLPQNNDIQGYPIDESIVFPPEIPSQYHSYSKSTVPESKNETTIGVGPPVFTKNFITNSQTENGTYSKSTDLKNLPKFHGKKGLISMAMEVAPDRPFTPVAITEPIIKPTPWIPLPVENENRPESPFVAALKTAPERVYSPLPSFTYASELEPTPIEDSIKDVKKTMFETPAFAQNSNFKSSEIGTPVRPVGNNPVRYMHGYNKRTPAKSPQIIAYSKPASTVNWQKEQSDSSDEPKKSTNLQPRLPFLKPKPSTGSVLNPVVSKSLTTDSNQCSTLDGKNVCRSLSQCKKILSESISTQMLIEASKKDRTHSSSQKQETVTLDVPQEIRSILPPNNNIKSISTSHYVVFPPEIPPEYRNYCRSKTSSPLPKHEINVEINSERVISSTIRKEDNIMSKSTLECSESNDNSKFSENLRTNTSNSVQKHGMNNETKSDCTISSAVQPGETKLSQSNDKFLETIEPNYVRESYESDNSITKTFDVGREKPISNITNTEPIAESKSIVDTAKDDRVESSMVAELKTDSGRSDSSLPILDDSSESIPKPTEPAIEPMTMADALAIAPDRSYKLSESNIKRPVGNNPVRYMHGYNKKTPVEPLLMTRHLLYAPTSAVDSEEEQIASLGLKSFPPISDELKLSTASGDFDRIESNFEKVEELVFDKLEFKESIKLLNKEVDAVEPMVIEQLDKPQHQQNIPENSPRASFSDTFSGKLIGPGIQDKVSLFMPKLSIEDTSFSKKKPNDKSPFALDSESSSLGDSSPKNSDSITHKSNNSEPNSSNYSPVETLLKSRISTKSNEESIPLTPHISQTDNTLVEPVTPTFKSSLPAAFLSKQLTCLMKKQQPKCIPSPIPIPDIGGQPTGKAGVSAGLTVPRRGRGVLNPQNLTPGAREPLCGQCHLYIRGPFITALGKIWCPEHFVCTNDNCKRPLQDIGFVEEDNGLYCEYCFEQYLAPVCHKCSKKIKGDCLNAIGKQFHPECFNCAYCGKLFGNSPFFLEDSLPYCENDWNELFTTKCIACGFPIEAGDRWVEALDKSYHSPCFNCSKCKTNLEGQSFIAKGGRPYCKTHAR